jgi:UDP-glucose 4-epimerase
LRCLITGGAGFIGSHLADHLVRRGAEVVVLDDLSTGSSANLNETGVELIVGSILDDILLERLVAGVGAVVHLAARPSVPRSIADPVPSHEANATGTLRVLEAVRHHSPGAHVTVASSSSVYGGNRTLPKTESLTLQPLSPYAVSKAAAEYYTAAYASCYGIAAMPFRFFNVYGPRQVPGSAYAAVIPAFLRAALRGESPRIYGDGSQTRDYTFVSTVVETIASGIERRVSGAATNLAFGSRTSLLELLGLVEQVTGRQIRPEHAAPRTGDVQDSQADPSRLRELFPDVRPTPLEDGLKATAGWMENYLRAGKAVG